MYPVVIIINVQYNNILYYDIVLLLKFCSLLVFYIAAVQDCVQNIFIGSSGMKWKAVGEL